MSLPSLSDLKGFLRVETAAENAALQEILNDVTADVLAYIGAPFTAVERTMTDDLQNETVYGVNTEILIPITPVDYTAPGDIEITDQDGNVIDPATYTVDPLTGIVTAKPGIAFPAGPFTIVADVGWSAHPDFATIYEPKIRGAILDWCASVYNQRNPGVVTESEPGASATYTQMEMPPRVKGRLAAMRNTIGTSE